MLGPVLARPEIAAMDELKKQLDPLKFLQRRLSVNQIGESELHRVSYVSPVAENATNVANAVVGGIPAVAGPGRKTEVADCD